MMELTITDLNVELSNENLSRVKQKARHMFSKIGDSVQKIKVIIDDINGPKGGKDKHCRVVIQTIGMPDIVITDNQTSTMTAVNIALSRAKNTLLRKVKRKQKNQPIWVPKEQPAEVDEYQYLE